MELDERSINEDGALYEGNFSFGGAGFTNDSRDWLKVALMENDLQGVIFSSSFFLLDLV